MDPLHATIEEFAAEGYTHSARKAARTKRLKPLSWA
jgi:hypothetical protein